MTKSQRRYAKITEAFDGLVKEIGPRHAMDHAIFLAGLELRAGHFGNEALKAEIEQHILKVRQLVSDLVLHSEA